LAALKLGISRGNCACSLVNYTIFSGRLPVPQISNVKGNKYS
jgi:hypothetical protein